MLGGGVVALLVLTTFWSELWPYLLGLAVAGGAGALGWWLWRTDRLVRHRDRNWREQDTIRAGHRSLAEVDAMSWQEFERYVADLCRRDGCTDVEVSGRSGDLGADVTGFLPDGRRLVVQCKHYAPHRYVPSGDMQKFVGTAWLHHEADVAVFAATCPFSKAALDLAVRHGILAVHRDLLGQWNTGTRLQALLPLNGTGQGDRVHRRRWKDTYGN
ncbi:restriction endonuclease [Streptomyces sp. NBC_01498]|nr:restriction endonuclease [Streptomyces sp. NBC_01498]